MRGVCVGGQSHTWCLIRFIKFQSISLWQLCIHVAVFGFQKEDQTFVMSSSGYRLPTMTAAGSLELPIATLTLAQSFKSLLLPAPVCVLARGAWRWEGMYFHFSSFIFQNDRIPERRQWAKGVSMWASATPHYIPKCERHSSWGHKTCPTCSNSNFSTYNIAENRAGTC